MISKDQLISMIDSEIEERRATIEESGMEDGDNADIEVEINELQKMMKMVDAEEALSFEMYSWLVDIVQVSLEIEGEDYDE